MTTRRSSRQLLLLEFLVSGCAAARPASPPELAPPGPTSSNSRRAQPQAPAGAAEPDVERFENWTQISHGNGNGHALADVHVAKVTILASNDSAKARYCEGGTPEPGATFGVAEAMVLQDERRLYYSIERELNGRWRYLVHVDGETTDGGPLCAACHEQGRSDPFFRPFLDVACP